MLKPLIAALCAGTLLDSVLPATALFALSFLFDVHLTGPDAAHIEPLRGAALWRYWVMGAAGALLALALRAPWQRLGRLRLLPLSRAAMLDDAVAGAQYALLFLAMFAYRVRLRDPAHALPAPFAAGVLQSAAALLVAALACHVVLAYAAPQRAAPLRFGANPLATAAGAALLLMALDLLAFERGAWIVLLVAAFVVVALGGGFISGGPAPPRTPLPHRQ